MPPTLQEVDPTAASKRCGCKVRRRSPLLYPAIGFSAVDQLRPVGLEGGLLQQQQQQQQQQSTAPYICNVYVGFC